MEPADRGMVTIPTLVEGEELPPPRKHTELPPVAVAPVPVAPSPYLDHPPYMMDVGPDEPWVDPLQKHFYVRGEYLLWWTRNDRIPPLASTSSADDLGIIGRPTTQVLFGGDELERDGHSGARFTAGCWLDCDEALEISGFFLGQQNPRFQARASDFPVIARPFFSLNRGSEFVELVSFPNEVAGNITIDSPSSLWGIEGNLRCNLCCGKHGCEGPEYRIDLIGGPRYVDLDERIRIVEDVTGLPTATDAALRNQQITVEDSFATRNQFYGAHLGIDAEVRKGPWSVQFRGKIGLGGTHQSVSIDGSQRFVSLIDGSTQTFTGGLLALPGNIGHRTRDRFSVMPEVDLRVGYDVSSHLRAFVGYNFLYWNNVARPGEQIDRVLDEQRIPNFRPGGEPTTQEVGQVRPSPLFRDSDFWAQGLTIGLELRY